MTKQGMFRFVAHSLHFGGSACTFAGTDTSTGWCSQETVDHTVPEGEDR